MQKGIRNNNIVMAATPDPDVSGEGRHAWSLSRTCFGIVFVG